MALGEVNPVGKNAARAIKILENAAAANSPPNDSADGVPCYPENQVYTSDTGHCYMSSPAASSTLMIAVNGTSTTAKLWGYLAAADEWFEIADINAGGAIAGNYSERLQDLGHFDRLYLEVDPTTATVNAWLATSRTVSY